MKQKDRIFPTDTEYQQINQGMSNKLPRIILYSKYERLTLLGIANTGCEQEYQYGNRQGKHPGRIIATGLRFAQTKNQRSNGAAKNNHRHIEAGNGAEVLSAKKAGKCHRRKNTIYTAHNSVSYNQHIITPSVTKHNQSNR